MLNTLNKYISKLLFLCEMRMRFSLTHISDPDGHLLIEEVEDEDNDKVDAWSSDRGGKLRSDERTHKLDLTGGAVLHDAGECCINR